MEIIQEEGRYQPDFQKSNYLKKLPHMEELYHFILKSFNRNYICLFDYLFISS